MWGESYSQRGYLTVKGTKNLCCFDPKKRPLRTWGTACSSLAQKKIFFYCLDIIEYLIVSFFFFLRVNLWVVAGNLVNTTNFTEDIQNGPKNCEQKRNSFIFWNSLSFGWWRPVLSLQFCLLSIHLFWITS